MESSFSVRYHVLKKFIPFLLILIQIGCEPDKEYPIEPVRVFTEVVKFDSSYTKVKEISTGFSDNLFSGKKGVFDSYSIMRFDSIPENFDSLFLRLESDSASVMLTLYKLKKEWSQDSIYLWGEIGSLIDTLSPPIKVEEVEDSNPRIYIGNSSTLDHSLIDEINRYGLAVHTDTFYSFSAEDSRLEIESEDTLADSVVSCVEDAYIVKNPFQDTVFSDSLLIGRGLSIKTNIFISADSLPSDLSTIAKALLVFEVPDTIPFSFWASINTSGDIYLPNYYSDNEMIKFDFYNFFIKAPDDDNFHIEIKATQVDEGVGVGRLGEGEFRFLWAEIPE